MTIPYNKCRIHTRFSPKTGRCMDCHKATMARHRAKLAGKLPPEAVNLSNALCSWKPVDVHNHE